MKLAYSSLACPGWTVEEAADAVARYGFDGIEWRLADGEPITSQTSPAVLRRVVEATQARGLRVPALDSSCQLAQVDDAGRSKCVREGEFMVNLALTLGAPAVRVFGGPLPDGVSIDEELAPAAEVLRRIAQHAAAHDIQILLGTHDSAWSRSATAVALTIAAGMPSVGILYDVLHPCRMGETVEQTVSTLGRHVQLVHVKDGHRPPDGAEEWPLCALGEGDVPLDRILALLQEQGYDGWYTFEWEKRWHPELAEPEVALPAGVAYLRARAASVSTAASE
ncbi:MAG TPA: sugar phosphate isomerase/epimerase [Ktedonobacterales bacterium]|nr:sugar phosphate isomerase/epimerase [Ktedonobacterales bacterium]